MSDLILQTVWRAGSYACELVLSHGTLRVLLWRGSRLVLAEAVDTYEGALDLARELRASYSLA